MINDYENNLKKTFEEKPSNKIVKHLFETQSDFIILGLCGKTGSGVSSAASILEKNFNDLHLNEPGNDELNNFDAHEYKKIYTYAQKKWMNFYKIRTKALITRYILTCEPDKFFEFIGQIYDIDENFVKEIISDFFDVEMVINLEDKDIFHKEISNESWDLIEKSWNELKDNSKKVEDELDTYVLSNGNIDVIRFIANDAEIRFKNCDLSRLFDYFAECRTKKKDMQYSALYLILYKYLYCFLPKKSHELWKRFEDIDRGLPTITLQCMGINLRITKDKYYFSEFSTDEGIDGDGFNVLAENINYVIKVFRACKYNFKLVDEKTMLVIDSIKNPYESMYLKNRYSNYYLIGIYTKENDRKTRLREKKHLNDDEIKAIDIIEQNSKFKKKIKICFKKWKNEYDEANIDEITRKEIPDLYDWPEMVLKILKLLHIKVKILEKLDTIAPFVLQNISDCLDSADIFINNIEEQRALLGLKNNLVRYICLIMNPAIVLPTNVERCMQIAYAMKANSGCISRQVGAIITDDEYRILSVGWNKQPEGQLPCSYRDLCELKYHWSNQTYSDYENDDDNEFQKNINDQVENFFYKHQDPLCDQGKLPTFCFKDYYNSIENNSNQVHTRALHAEEIAFLDLAANKNRAKNGILFVTASPCELCSKKAMNIGISKIYYIEPYPGISQQHVLSIGNNNRPEQILFTGAIGTAYYRLYTPLMPQKDEYAMWLGTKMDIDLMKNINSGKDEEKNKNE